MLAIEINLFIDCLQWMYLNHCIIFKLLIVELIYWLIQDFIVETMKWLNCNSIYSIFLVFTVFHDSTSLKIKHPLRPFIFVFINNQGPLQSYFLAFQFKNSSKIIQDSNSKIAKNCRSTSLDIQGFHPSTADMWTTTRMHHEPWIK